MQGFQCDSCRQFAPLVQTQNLWGSSGLTVPEGWLITTEQPSTKFSGLIAALTDSPNRQDTGQPPSFCSRVCAADFFLAATLIDGPAAT